LKSPPDIIPDAPSTLLIERQQVRAVAVQLVVVDPQQVHVLRLHGQEHLAAAGHLHQLGALAGEGLLEQLAHAAAARVLELHVALVGDHRAELGLDRHLVEADLQQLVVLERERVLGSRFLELGERAVHVISFGRGGGGCPRESD
jgi:hypothetical protein